LASILDKGLAAMTTEEQGAIRRKYTALEVREKIDLPLLLWTLGAAALLVGIFAYWNRRLAAEIRLRTDTEAKLRASERRLNEAQSIASLGHWELDLGTKELVWSDETFRIFEIDKTRFDASYEGFLSAIHPDDRAAVDTAYSDSLATGRPYGIVHRLLMPDGRIKYVQERCETIYADDGHPVRSLGTIQDITEQKLNELELEKHRHHRESLIASRIQEHERRQLATQLHDSPMQKLALAQLQFSALTDSTSISHENIANGLDLMHEALDELHTLQFELSPPVLYRDGLAAALAWLASHISDRFGITLTFDDLSRSVRIDDDHAVLLFQCTRELVYNIAKHAQSPSGKISLSIDKNHLVVTVSDQGIGFQGANESERVRGGFGLFSIRERLGLIDGHLDIQTSSTGTIATIHIPLPQST
jgi:signal transduction histidine kinase